MSHLKLWLGLLGLLLVPEGAFATDVAVVRIKGYEIGGALTLEISPGPAATRAIRIYSEPSHTLLAIVEDNGFAASEEGKQWRRAVASQMPRARAVTSLPEGRPRLVLDARPETDDRVAAWVYGSWPDGKVEDRLVGDGKVGSGDFDFSVAAPFRSEEECAE